MYTPQQNTVSYDVTQHAKWQLTGRMDGVQLKAFSLNSDHKDRTLKYWKELKATNVAIVELPGKPLPTWNIEVPGNKPIRITLQASSKAVAISILRKKKYREWQIASAKFEVK
jgi:hypothetical protein